MSSSLAEDDAADARNASQNSFESYINNLRHSLSKLNDAVDKAIEWYDISQEASKQEYEQKRMEIEGIVKYVYFPFNLMSEFFALSPLPALSYKDSTMVCSLLQTKAGGTSNESSWAVMDQSWHKRRRWYDITENLLHIMYILFDIISNVTIE